MDDYTILSPETRNPKLETPNPNLETPIFAFIIRGLKEFGEPTRKAMIMELSVKKAEARSFGLYYFIRDFIVSFAAFFGGLLWKISPEINLFTASLTGVAGTLFFLFFGKGTDKLKQS